MVEENAPAILQRPDGTTLAYHYTPGGAPGVMFCGGLMSDMTGTKATALEAYAQGQGLAFVRFDYLGHGASSGAFTDGTIGRWAEDTVFVLDELTDGPQVLVGSSMAVASSAHSPSVVSWNRPLDCPWPR